MIYLFDVMFVDEEFMLMEYLFVCVMDLYVNVLCYMVWFVW